MATDLPQLTVPPLSDSAFVSGRFYPTGRPYQIIRGDMSCTVGSVAAVLREFSAGGTLYTEVWDADSPAPYGCGIVLAPWPNRIADGKWVHDGKVQKLDITDLGLGNAIHGLLRNTSYELTSYTREVVALSATIYPQHGYPFIIDTRVTYELTDDGLRVTHRLANVGSTVAPVGVGAHPYLRVGEHPIKDLTLTLNADTYLPVDERKLPTGRLPVDGTANDLRGGVLLDTADLDTAFTDLHPIGEEYQATLMAPDGTGVTLWADLSFGYIQAFTPRDYPGRELTVAVEPMTCPANAFNTGEALRWLQPGEVFEGSWGLRPIR